ARSLAVRVSAVEGARGAPVPVDLLFGRGPRARRQRLIVGRSGAASWTPGDAATWPVAVDLGFPTIGDAVIELGESTTASLRLPPTAVFDLRVEELDGELCTEVATASLRVPAAAAPADRWHALRAPSGALSATVEAGGQRVEVRVTTRSGREARGVFRAPERGGERARCVVSLSGADGARFRCPGLPTRAGGWWVEVFGVGGGAPARAPRAGASFLVFGVADATGAQPIDDGALVLARSGEELWWGVMASRSAVMQECALLARGALVGADGRGLAGAPIELVELRSPEPRVLRTIRTDREGAFELRGPDAEGVRVALRVPATGEVVTLPQRQRLSLRAKR
ncbi:MAG: hypothetical protein ACON4Z_07055, partial [Planctomycetota bacterium]